MSGAPTDRPADETVALATLAGIGELGPAAIRRALADAPDARCALRRLERAQPGCWPDQSVVAQLLARRGTRVWRAGDPDYPIEVELEDRPEILLAEGERHDALDAPRVAVVGTRAATPHGLADARELGAALALAGVTVVSGLAIGIDAAAHEGALGAGGLVVGVLATGPDVVYPRRHTSLFDRVRERGVLITEHGFGIPPARWRFPVRNRIIAGLADITVVVEATERGGARITADAAMEYGRTVFAYPGSRRNRAAAGCNRLIADSAQVALGPDDVLTHLGMVPGGRRGADGARRPATPEQRAVLAALGGEAAGVDELTGRTGLTPATVALAVSGLVKGGFVERAQGLLWPR